MEISSIDIRNKLFEFLNQDFSEEYVAALDLSYVNQKIPLHYILKCLQLPEKEIGKALYNKVLLYQTNLFKFLHKFIIQKELQSMFCFTPDSIKFISREQRIQIRNENKKMFSNFDEIF